MIQVYNSNVLLGEAFSWARNWHFFNLGNVLFLNLHLDRLTSTFKTKSKLLLDICFITDHLKQQSQSCSILVFLFILTFACLILYDFKLELKFLQNGFGEFTPIYLIV